jgi:hypothetical protein
MMKKVGAREVTHTSNYSNSNSCSLCKKAAAYAVCNSCCLCNRTAHQNQPNGMGGKIEKNHCFCFRQKITYVMFFGKNTYTTLFTNKYPYCAKVSNDAYVHVHRIPYGIPALFVLDDFFVNTVRNCSLLLFL